MHMTFVEKVQMQRFIFFVSSQKKQHFNVSQYKKLWT